MNIQILREFADLAYTLSFQKTAERMYISHSALSKHIRFLEKELGGISLFYRTRHSVELTELGKSFLPRIQKVLAEYDDAVALLTRQNANISGAITIGFLDAAVRDFLPGVLEQYRTNYPEMKVQLFSGQIGDLLAAYFNDSIDVSLTLLFPNVVPPTSAEIRTLYEDSIRVVFPKGHPLENKNEIFLDDLLHYPLILPSHQQFSDYASLIEQYIEHGPIPPNIICDYTHVDTALLMAEANMGITLLPNNISRVAQNLLFREITDFRPAVKMIVAWNKSRIRPGTMEFVELLCKHF